MEGVRRQQKELEEVGRSWKEVEGIKSNILSVGRCRIRFFGCIGSVGSNMLDVGSNMYAVEKCQKILEDVGRCLMTLDGV